MFVVGVCRDWNVALICCMNGGGVEEIVRCGSPHIGVGGPPSVTRVKVETTST